MEKYNTYNVEAFASDNDFITWCIQPNSKTERLWHQYIQSHPEQKDTILEAKQLVLDIQSIEREEHQLNFESEIWSSIEKTITEQSSIHTLPKSTSNFKYRWIGIAASFLAIICFTILLYQNLTPSTSKLGWINIENNSGNAKTIQLSDHSKVILEPFSTLKYPAHFLGEQRTVFLTGEAFFDIARDTSKPFLVYANETITKVLGTSFTITAFEGQETVEVDVKTGKVAVYAKVKSDKKTSNKKMLVEADEQIFVPLPNKKLEVTPNQKVVFDKKIAVMAKEVTALPQVITDIKKLVQFDFNNESVIKVFEALEQAYGIDLVCEVEKLESCTITTKLDSEPLFQKLNIICMALGLEYSEKNAKILIQGAGCTK